MSKEWDKVWRVLLFAVAGWVNREQLKVIEYLKQENRLLRAQIKQKRIRLTEADRRKLADKGRPIGRKKLKEVATIACADTIHGAGRQKPYRLLRWVFSWKKIVLRVGDKKYTRQFNQILSDGGIESKQLPARSPNLNAYAERFVLTLKSECLKRMIFIGESSLRRSIVAYMEHYHHERSHQGMNNEIIIPFDHAGQDQGLIQRKHRLGGMLSYYYRVAA